MFPKSSSIRLFLSFCLIDLVQFRVHLLMKSQIIRNLTHLLCADKIITITIMPDNQPLRKKIKLDNRSNSSDGGAKSIVESSSISDAAVSVRLADSDSKKRRKLKKSKVKVKVSDSPVPKRDFSTDLFEYLRSWSDRDRSDDVWKFNKVLQNWSLDSCYDKGKVNTATFKLWLKYLPTIKGGALDRIMIRTDEILLVGDNAAASHLKDGHEGGQGAPKSAVSRARKVKEVLDFVRSGNSYS